MIVAAKDAYNNNVTTYQGTVHFTSTDTNPAVVLPADYPFTATDRGVHTFTNGVTLYTVGSQTVTATDTVNSSLTGHARITVNPAPAPQSPMRAPAPGPAGNSIRPTASEGLAKRKVPVLDTVELSWWTEKGTASLSMLGSQSPIEGADALLPGWFLKDCVATGPSAEAKLSEFGAALDRIWAAFGGKLSAGEVLTGDRATDGLARVPGTSSEAFLTARIGDPAELLWHHSTR
jgi:hypothetical protein